MKTILDYFIKRPLLLSALICILISVFAFYLHILVAFLSFAIAVAIGFMIYFKTDARIIFTSVLIFMFCLSFSLTLENIASLKRQSGTTLRAECILSEITYKTDEYYTAVIRVNKSDRLHKGTKITAFYAPQQMNIGDSFVADIKLNEIKEGSYKAHSYSNSVYLGGSLSNITPTENDDMLLKAVGNLRQYIKTTLMEHLEYNQAATVCALLFGERDYFNSEFSDNIRNAGVSHVMVVSGMHLAIIVSFITKIMERIFYNRYAKAILIVGVVLLLCLLCGFTMSILRAGVTYLIIAVGLMLDRKGKAENSLGGAVTLILIFSPFAWFNLSLQLSVLSTFAILVVALPLVNEIKSKFRMGFVSEYAVTSVIFSLSALIFTLPVTIYNFGCISTVSVISNLLISSAVTWVLYFAFTCLVLNPLLPFVTDWIFMPLSLLAEYINFVINYMGSLSFASVEISKYWSVAAVIFILLVLLILTACKKRQNMLKLNSMNEKIVREGGGKLKWRR